MMCQPLFIKKIYEKKEIIMKVIYEPKGRAREYSELACNLYRGCPHGCRYCFGPAVLRTTKEKFHTMAGPRKNIIELFEEDAKKLKDETRHILFCFTSDPYQPLERTERLTHQALEIVKKYGLNSQVLTKGKAELIHEDLELMKATGTQLGITLCFSDDETRKYWEPDASTVNERLAILKEAHEAGIYTWVSLEPVIDPEQALDVIRTAHPFVDFWKVGKLNHMKDVERGVDWVKFLFDVEELLLKHGARYYIKNDLRSFGLRN
jgi:DNA repair photolyase